MADMDLWVVATAAAAGYLAKYWQNILKEDDSLSPRSSSDSKFENLESSDHSFNNVAQNQICGRDFKTDRRKVLGERYLKRNCSDLASTNGFGNEKLQDLENYHYGNVLSLSNPPWEWVSENLKENGRENLLRRSMVDDNYRNSLPSPSTRGMGSFHGTGRKIGLLKTKNSYSRSIKPINSLESCVMTRLYKNNEMEKYVSCSSPPSTPTTRPFDGKNHSTFTELLGLKHNKMEKESYFERNEHVYGVPQLPNISSSETLKKKNGTRGCRHYGNMSSSGKMVLLKHGLNDEGIVDGLILFFFGISVGIISSLVWNKGEVDQLKEVLKQTEDLVQDLQEELEMKDSITVQELSNEYCESRDTCGNSFPERTLGAFALKPNMDDVTKFDGSKSNDQKAEESLDSMSKIEAELEAELERLGLGINTYNNDARFSDLIELDPEFLDDFADGELMMADIIHGEQNFQRAKPNREMNYSTGNYIVSPWELSLRLHEVIQLRLELQVNELERKLLFMQSQSKLPSSTELSPVSKTRPLAMNLSGEALNTYNKALDDFAEENSSSDFRGNNEQSRDELLDHSIEKKLIEKIVEKTREGSPIVLNAQKWLFSLNEEEI